MKELNDYERGFLDGLIDGEGCISIYLQKDSNRVKKAIRIVIANNNIKLLKKAFQIIGSGSFIMKVNKKNDTVSYEYRIPKSACQWLLPQLTLIVKKEKVKDVLEEFGKERLT